MVALLHEALGVCEFAMKRFVPDRNQVLEFAEQGFLIIRGLFDSQEMSDLLSFARSDLQVARDAYVRKDAQGGATRLALSNELDEESVYAAIVRSESIAGAMTLLLGDEVYHYHHKLTLKDARIGGAWEWHQDYGYWYDNGCLFPDMGSCWIAIDRATRANGCMQVIPGSHKMGRVNHVQVGEQTGADPDRVAACLERMELRYCEMEGGDALYFHGNLLHRSDSNTSDDPRWSLICCYNTRHNDPYLQGGRHPNYSPLIQLPDAEVSARIRSCQTA